MTNNTQGDLHSQPVLFRGAPVANRQDCEESIARRVQDEGITADEAWFRIQSETLAFLETSAAAERPEASIAARQSGASKKQNPIAVLNAVPGSAGCDPFNDLDDSMIPEHLRGSGKSVIEMIESGELPMLGQHPLSEVLRSTARDGTEGELAKEEIQLRLKSAQPLQLSLLMPGRQAVRVMPSDFSKTSLFHATSNNVPRRYCRNEKLGQVGNQVTIFYQGEELRQTDEAIFRELIYQARGKAPWDWITLNQCHFRDAKGTQRRLSGEDISEVHQVLMRLRSGLLLIKSSKRRCFITCNLLVDYEGIGDSRRVRIDPRLVLLFDSYAALDEQVLHSLSGLPQKLYEYIVGIPHTILHPINLTSLFELCYGRKEYIEKAYLDENTEKSPKQAKNAVDKKYSDFIRKNLPNALTALRDGKRIIVSFEIDYNGEKVYIVKNPDNTIEAKEFSLGG